MDNDENREAYGPVGLDVAKVTCFLLAANLLGDVPPAEKYKEMVALGYAPWWVELMMTDASQCTRIKTEEQWTRHKAETGVQQASWL